MSGDVRKFLIVIGIFVWPLGALLVQLSGAARALKIAAWGAAVVWLVAGLSLRTAPVVVAPVVVTPVAQVAQAERPTSTPRPAATAVPTVPPYEVASSRQSSTPNRLRYQTDIVVPSDYGREDVIAALADAARRTLREHPDVKAAVVFAYIDAENVNKGYDKGRALISSDGNGWAGDKKWLGGEGQDTGRIAMTIGSAIGRGEAVEVAK
jgi:hypothetical protein